jgi:pimeloyl-ACP methyl ester carboxylesterase
MLATPMPAPFQRVPFARLPIAPRVPHRYDDTVGRDVVVASSGFGRVRIHVREHGSGPPLLLLHGLMTSSYSYRYVLESLGARYRLIIPDLPGAGRSDMPDVPYTTDALAAFLVELVDTLGLRGAPCIGNSLGGFLAMKAVLRDPGVVSRLVNVHSPAFPIARLRALAIALAIPGARAVVRRVIARDPERWVWRNVHYFDETLKSREETRAYGAPLSTEAGRVAFLRYLTDTMAPSGFASFVAQLEARRAPGQPFPIPLLLLYSRQDPLVPPNTGERLHALVPGARLTWLDATSHFAHVDSPGRLVTAALSFLEVPAARGAAV